MVDEFGVFPPTSFQDEPASPALPSPSQRKQRYSTRRRTAPTIDDASLLSWIGDSHLTRGAGSAAPPGIVVVGKAAPGLLLLPR
jgi:hypothetical protein